MVGDSQQCRYACWSVSDWQLTIDFCGILYTLIFSARCNIYISRLCCNVSVRLSVRLSLTEVHWHIIANLGFKFRSKCTTHCGRSPQCAHMHCKLQCESQCMRVHCGRGACWEEGRGHLALC